MPIHLGRMLMMVSCCIGGMLLAHGPLLSGAANPPFLVSYLQARNPSQLSILSDLALPQEFSKYPFSLYYASGKDDAADLESVLVVPRDSSTAWQSLAREQNWLELDVGERLFYFNPASSLADETELLSQIEEHQRVPPDSAASGGSLADLHAFLEHISFSAESRERFIESVVPFLEGRADQLGTYNLWLLDELSNVERVSWQFDPSRGAKSFAVTVAAKPRVRLYRLFSRARGSPSKLFSYISKEAPNLNLGWLNGVNANNYFNYWFKATADIENPAFQAIRSDLDKLDAGIFDRWDGSWAKYNTAGGEDRILLLGGRFQSSDLSDIFEVLAQLPTEPLAASILLDRDNSVAGFSRVRSVEWMEDTPSLLGRWIPEKFFMAVANGTLVISESDSALIEMIFVLNGRRPLSDSAILLLESQPQYSMQSYRDSEMWQSVTLQNGELVFFERDIPDWMNRLLTKAIKNWQH